mmetsp:Transcript_14023/g.33127  ORF Transcript_14023/g.33127 Transcript_14023/m.33127 type:complete len:94 (-) Transcript_14023:1160-1441(-)
MQPARHTNPPPPPPAAGPPLPGCRYSTAEYSEFCAALRKKALELNRASDREESGQPWSAVLVERALWSAAMAEVVPSAPDAGAAPDAKRRRRG